jgi:hypothetical protein
MHTKVMYLRTRFKYISDYAKHISAHRLNVRVKNNGGKKPKLLFNPLKPKLTYIIFQASVRTAKKTPHFTVTKINRLTLFKE